MLCAFLDDSKQDGWLGLLGLVIDSERLIDLEKKFAEVLRAHGVPIDDDSKDTEIKWSPGKGKWLRDGLKEGRREALYRGILDLLEGGEAALVGALLHHAEMKGYDEERAYSEAYVHTFERVDALAEVKRTPVIVLADSEGGKAKATERVKQTLGLVRKGTKYKKLDRIYQHAQMVDSRYHAGIQVADVIAGVTVAMASGHLAYAKPLWPLLQGRFKRLKGNSTPQQWSLSILPTPSRQTLIDQLNPYGWPSDDCFSWQCTPGARHDVERTDLDVV